MDNETEIAVTRLLGEHAVDKNGRFDGSTYVGKVEEIMTFIDSMLNFYETGRYIFVHGWRPIISEGRYAECLLLMDVSLKAI